MRKLSVDIENLPADERQRIDDEIAKIEKRIDQRAGELMQHALIEVFKKQRPGEPPTVDNSKSLVRSLFFDPKRYDLTRVGRYKLNARLDANVDPEVRTLTNPRFTGRVSGMSDDLVDLIRRLVDLPIRIGVPEDSKDFAADALDLPARRDRHRDGRVRALRQPPPAHRRRADPGGVPDRLLPHGARRARAMSTEDVDTITPQTIINIRPVVAALKEFFGSSQLSQFMDQTNTLAGLTHRRRLSALGAGGLTRERAPIEVRDVHPTHYGRMCPIETPEGPNIGLIGSLGTLRHRQRVRVHPNPLPARGEGRRHRPPRVARRRPRKKTRSSRRPTRQVDEEGQAGRAGAVPARRRAGAVRRPKMSTTWTSRRRRSSRSRPR